MTVQDCAMMVLEWLSMIWNGIFKVPIIGDITGATLIIGVFAVSLSIWIIHYFRDNTHAEMGGK